jgi:hypothetical protein
LNAISACGDRKAEIFPEQQLGVQVFFQGASREIPSVDSTDGLVNDQTMHGTLHDDVTRKFTYSCQGGVSHLIHGTHVQVIR